MLDETMGDKMKIAYCILTYNHVDTLLRVSMENFELFERKGIDIYIYDSSTDTQTHSLYLAWLTKGITNLHYVDCKHIHSGDEKMFYVIQGYGLEEEYDYLWATKDRMFLSEKHVDDILEALNSYPDVVLAAKKNDSYFYEVPNMPEEFDEPVQFFRYFGATSTSWGSVIFNYQTMLKNIDWSVYDKKYGINGRNPFIQPCTLFWRLSELKKMSIKIIRPDDVGRLAYTISGSGWIKDTIQLWGVIWPNQIRKLPSIYDDFKDYVIKVETMHPLTLGSVQQLIYLRQNDWLTPETFEMIREDFTNLSDIPMKYIEYILNKEYNTLYNCLYNDFVKALKDKNYFKAMWIHNTAPLLNQFIGDDEYIALERMFKNYHYEMMDLGHSETFANVDDVIGAIRKFVKECNHYYINQFEYV